jgi:hypothetical protein
MWGMWDEKINGDSETRNWLAANTKPCPKCSKPVEKNGGCNLVLCKCGQVRRTCSGRLFLPFLQGGPDRSMLSCKGFLTAHCFPARAFQLLNVTTQP